MCQKFNLYEKKSIFQDFNKNNTNQSSGIQEKGMRTLAPF